MEEQTQETEKLKTIIYKLAREKELTEQEAETIEKIIEKKDYPQENTYKKNPWSP